MTVGAFGEPSVDPVSAEQVFIVEGKRNPPLGLCVRLVAQARHSLEWVERNAQVPDYVRNDLRRSYLMVIEAHRTLEMYSKIKNHSGDKL